MRYLSHKRQRFLDSLKNVAIMYSYANQREQLLISAGVLNSIWNLWNNFWRDYWIAHVSGGYDFGNNIIHPLYNGYNDKQSCHYLLYACNKRSNHLFGATITGSHQEATWGDPNIISLIAIKMTPHHGSMAHLSGILGYYQTHLQHFQRIRNTLTHLNNENVFHLNAIAGYYSFGADHRLIDILESVEISSSTRCFNNLINNMEGLVQNL